MATESPGAPARSEVTHHLLRMADASRIVRRGEQPVMLDGRPASDLTLGKLAELAEAGLFDWWPDVDDANVELGLPTHAGGDLLRCWDDELALHEVEEVTPDDDDPDPAPLG